MSYVIVNTARNRAFSGEFVVVDLACTDAKGQRADSGQRRANHIVKIH